MNVGSFGEGGSTTDIANRPVLISIGVITKAAKTRSPNPQLGAQLPTPMSVDEVGDSNCFAQK
jgi:hypothetical protein